MNTMQPPQLDRHSIIEALLGGMETSMRTKAAACYFKDAPFLEQDEAFREETRSLNALADETLMLFNDISRRIGGIPVRVLHEQTVQAAHLVKISAWQEGTVVFTCRSNDTQAEFQTDYTHVDQIRNAYYSATQADLT